MKRIYFGTDGVRGPYGGPVVNEAFAARLGLAAGRWAGGSGRAVLARDTRASGPALEAAVAAGLRAAGLEVASAGVAPTPALARLVRAAEATLGVVVTASHNPAGDNGVKFFGRGGLKLADAEELAIEQLLPPPDEVIPAAGLIPVCDAVSGYLQAAADLLPPGSLTGWTLAVDTANGATAATSPRALAALGAQVVSLGDQPNGININDGVGSEHPEALQAVVRAARARVGIAHDGDGDRCVLCDEHGQMVSGDEVLTLLALHALGQGRLPGKRLVVTRQSNLGVDQALRAAGGSVVRTDIGDRYVMERMLADGAMLGGESSGHIICADSGWCGDGLVAALRVLDVMLDTGQPLSALRRALVAFPQGTRNLRVSEKRPLEACLLLGEAIRKLEGELGDRGRVLVRYSGTEAKLRLLVEAESDVRVANALDRLEDAARRDLTVT